MMELSYLAGLFDGEGTIGVNPRYSNDHMNGNLYLGIAVGNTDKRACKMFQVAFGGGVYLNHKATERSKAYWIWVLNSAKAGQALRSLRPFLVLKARQADIAISFADHMWQNRWKRHTPEKIAFRYKCRNQLIRLHGFASRVKHRPTQPSPVANDPMS